jgi:hypothetical protein
VSLFVSALIGDEAAIRRWDKFPNKTNPPRDEAIDRASFSDVANAPAEGRCSPAAAR